MTTGRSCSVHSSSSQPSCKATNVSRRSRYGGDAVNKHSRKNGENTECMAVVALLVFEQTRTNLDHLPAGEQRELEHEVSPNR